MLTFDKSDGSIVIDFPAGPVRVKAPTFGGMKRLRAARVQFARAAQDRLAAWEAEHPEPDGEGENEPDPTLVARRAEDRLIEDEAAKLESTEKWWRLVLVGDESFKRLTDDPVPDNVDEWPAFLLYDVRPAIPPNSSLDVILSAQSIPDRVVRHWGEGQSRFSSGNGAGQPTSP